MRRVFLTLCAAITLVACQKETMDQRILREAQEYNAKECPKMLDTYTRIDSMHFDQEQQIIEYCYTMVGEYDSPEFYTDQVKKEFRAQLLSSVRGSIALKPYKDLGLTFRYTYYSDRSGQILAQETFSKEEYE